ncbi:Abi-alpha family protein [Staphylococcus aureus]|uniref:Abi-alpha family protein n=1 Tax=Staphylococcus aureus TaxID=1280 RepID=UPI0039EEB3B1
MYLKIIYKNHNFLLGPALEASKFYISEKTLSNMFAKLIASSMDAQKKLINPPFIC